MTKAQRVQDYFGKWPVAVDGKKRPKKQALTGTTNGVSLGLQLT